MSWYMLARMYVRDVGVVVRRLRYCGLNGKDKAFTGICQCLQGASALRVLGLHEGCSVQQVRSAYRHLAGKWHPDKWLQSEESERAAAADEFRKVQEAFESLTA